jgi:predicted MFS family arabinose efflux permease
VVSSLTSLVYPNLTNSLRIGLCITNNFTVFLAISFITAITTVTPQIMLPLVGELAPPFRRAVSLSIVVSGNMLGIVIARILSGVVTTYTSWRNIYWIALALQFTIWSLLWLFMPDYPSSNPQGMNYFRMLFSILTLYRRYAVLVHAGAVSFCNSAAFTSYWTTLTFLLSSPPYSYPPYVIGLLGLIGLFGIFTSPVYARYIVQPHAPWLSVVIGSIIGITGIAIGTYAGKHTVAGPILQAFALDASMQLTQIANRAAIYSIEPTGRNRVNTAFMLMTFLGQLTGTASGNKLYERGGWIASGSLSVGLVAVNFLLCAIRGPWEEGWVGWSGGWGMKKADREGYTQDEGEEKRRYGDGDAEGVDDDAVQAGDMKGK